MFIPDIPIKSLRPASYNPREITPNALEMLRESIRAIGFAKPIIVNQAGTIIAGHQRTKAASAEGIETVPGFLVRNASVHDEVMFNQLHNASDVDEHAGDVNVGPSSVLGFEMVAPANIRCPEKAPGIVFRNEICRLTANYGPWGSAIATQSGRVVASRQVAAACRALGEPLRVFRIPDALEDEALRFTSRQYGVYSYKHIQRNAWIQTLAQPFRLRNAKNRQRSCLYEDMLLREVDGKKRILDFGCGQGDYVEQLARVGFNIAGVEFFYRPDQGGNTIDTVTVNKMIDGLCSKLRTSGLFDVTICDSVINSVCTVQAEADVLTCLNAFTAPGGTVFFSSRKMEHLRELEKQTQMASRDRHRRHVAFTDSDGFEAKVTDGSWFFQKYHTREQMVALAEKFIGPVKSIKQNTGYWLLKVSRTVRLPVEQVEAAIRREFNLDWPEGMTVNRHEDVIVAWTAARQG